MGIVVVRYKKKTMKEVKYRNAQFENIARLKAEYSVDAIYEHVELSAARWVQAEDPKKFDKFTQVNQASLYRDAEGNLTFLAPSQWHLDYTMEQWPDIQFVKTKEHN